MVAIPLTSGAYSAQSYIASAQRCINLYPEKNPAEIKAPFPFTHYVRPGLKLLAMPPVQGKARCLYGSSKGSLFAVIDQSVYYIDNNFTYTNIGTLVSPASTPAYFSDNGTTALLVDGSEQGYTVTLAQPTSSFVELGDPNYFGSTRADFIDSFIILNIPGTNQWYCTPSDAITPFNALYVGIKTAWPDNILCAVAIEREVWLFGPKKSEVWYNAGAVPFPFQILPGVIIEQGCSAPYSPAKMDTNVYWLSESPEGARMVMRGNAQNVAQRISTHAIEAEFLTYPKVSDAIGSTYQIEGHSFYKLHFPTADKTWGYDEATQQWHEDNSIDANGVLHRARNTFNTYCYGKNLALDWATGALYQVDSKTYTDNGQVIPWIRSFPHFTNELKYVTLSGITADVETGTRPGTGETTQYTSPWSLGFSSGFGPLGQVSAPAINLRLSRDGGNSYGNNRPKQMVSAGHYRSMMRWRGNGLSRDWVVELSSTAEMSGALNGVYVDPIGATS
jgi:hypothetical protein